MHPITFVFDIDDTLCKYFYSEDSWKKEIEETVEAYGQDFVDRHRLTCCGYPHFIFPGIPELWRWLHDQGHALATFSSAVKERNEQLVQGLASLAFGEQARDILPSIRIFSREDCLDTTRLPSEKRSEVQPVFFGNKKKVMTQVVSSPENMPWTLLIDDDRSYMALHEEYNLIVVECLDNMDAVRPELLDFFTYYYKAFYMAGLFQTIFDVMKKKNCTAVEAAKYVQFDSIGGELKWEFGYPTKRDLSFYSLGEKILQGISPEARICPQAMEAARRLRKKETSFIRKFLNMLFSKCL